MILRRSLLAGVALLAALHPAKADFTFTLGTGATGFSFTSTTGGTALCAAASTHCFASVPVNTAGAQLFTAGVPGVINATQWASTALGAPSQFGTTPGAVNVPGVNAAIISSTQLDTIISNTNSPAPCLTATSANTNSYSTGQTQPINCNLNGNLWVQSLQSGTWNIANISGTISLPSGASTSALQSAQQGSVTGGTAATVSVLYGSTYSNSYPFNLSNGQQLANQVDAFGHLRTGQDGLGIPATSCSSACAATTLFSQDMIGYESITVQVTSAGTGATITYQTSDDNSTWVSSSGMTSVSTGNSPWATTSTAAGMLQFPRRGRFFRAQITAYTSGTVTALGTLSKTPVSGPTAVASSSPSGTLTNVAGAVAVAATASGSPVYGGCRGSSVQPTAVANNQAQHVNCTTIGTPIAKPYSVPELDWTYPAAAGGISNTTTAVTMIAAAAAGIRNYATGCQISADALGAATELAVRDGAGGTVLWRTKIQTAGLAAQTVTFPTPIRGTAATLLEVVTLTASITGAVYVNCQGYQAP